MLPPIFEQDESKLLRAPELGLLLLVRRSTLAASWRVVIP